MKPSYYLEPDAEKMRTFFRSFSLPEDVLADLEKISIHKIWIDEADNSWELEYDCAQPVQAGLLDTVTKQFTSFFALKSLYWKKREPENRSEETIRTETEQKRTEILQNANTQAQSMVNDASQKANQMVEQATQDANSLMERANHEASACIEAAKAEAQHIIQDAEKKAQELVEEENIVRRARVESEELRESAKADAANLHKNTLDYIDSLLAETDRKMSELINNIRLERNEIRNHR